jgi:hypothetical protein
MATVPTVADLRAQQLDLTRASPRTFARRQRGTPRVVVQSLARNSTSLTSRRRPSRWHMRNGRDGRTAKFQRACAGKGDRAGRQAGQAGRGSRQGRRAGGRPGGFSERQARRAGAGTRGRKAGGAGKCRRSDEGWKAAARGGGEDEGPMVRLFIGCG